MTRLCRVHDLVLGGLLYVAFSGFGTRLSKSDSALTKGASHDAYRLLLLEMVIDSVDTVSSILSILSIWSRDMERRAILLIPGGAAAFVALAGLALGKCSGVGIFTIVWELVKQ